MAEAQTHPEGGNTFTLSGRVTDENQDPLELATVTILPQMKVAFTNLKGNYSLSGVSADSVVVRFSMVGYRQRRVSCAVRRENLPCRCRCLPTIR